MDATAPFFEQWSWLDLTLRVRELDRLRPFYREVLGLTELSATASSVSYGGADGRPLVQLVADRAARPAAPTAVGLFHAALLGPDRAFLGRCLRRWQRWPGVRYAASDHGVSEALYLFDPEGNGWELYTDRPAAAWPMHLSGDVAMDTQSGDVETWWALAERDAPGEASAAPLRLGHLHLRGAPFQPTAAALGQALGLSLRQRDYPGALFLGYGGYHHHLAVNGWGNPRPAESGTTGLLEARARVPRAVAAASGGEPRRHGPWAVVADIPHESQATAQLRLQLNPTA